MRRGGEAADGHEGCDLIPEERVEGCGCRRVVNNIQVVVNMMLVVVNMVLVVVNMEVVLVVNKVQ